MGLETFLLLTKSTVRQQLISIFFTSDLKGVRFFLSLAALIWAVMLFWPGDTFTRPTYGIMEQAMPEEAWAALFGIQGVVMLGALLYDYRGRAVVFLDCILECVLWTSCTIAMFLSVFPPPAAISAEIAMAVASWWNLVRFLSDGVNNK